jgi:hypothetical protein
MALEYVEGRPLDVYCRERGVGVRGRLRLLLQVADAVAFAHSRLVVHRDLKPSNILVTADGQVRLLDFGIAKLMEGDTTKETQLTQLAGRALTLDYASPEQIKGEPIGTASDVYSLGVVAYELLTGAKPYKLKRGSAAELEDAIATADVPKASDAAAEPQVKRALKGDLDAILNKALKKSAQERFATVDALAQDIQRHLNSESVGAQPDALAYRAGKFFARYRLQVTAAGFAIAALGTGVAVALWQAQEAQRQRDRAVEAARTADENARRALEASLRADQERGRAVAAQSDADASAATANDAARRASAAADAERRAAELARTQELSAREQSERAQAIKQVLFDVFGRVTLSEGGKPVSQVTMTEAIDALARDFSTRLAKYPDAEIEVATFLGSIYRDIDRPADAFRWLEHAVQALQRAGANVGVRDRIDLRTNVAQAAFMFNDVKRFRPAVEALEAEIAAAGFEGERYRARALSLRGRLLAREARSSREYLPLMQEAAARFARDEPESMLRLFNENALVIVLSLEDRDSEAVRHADEAVAFALRHGSRQIDVADALSVRGRLRLDLDQAREAVADLQAARVRYVEVEGEAAFRTAQNDVLLGRALVASGDIEAGLRRAEGGVAAMARARPNSGSLAQSLEWQAMALLSAGQPDRARQLIDQALSIRRDTLKVPPRAMAMTKLLAARAARLAGERTAAAGYLTEVEQTRAQDPLPARAERLYQEEVAAQAR